MGWISWGLLVVSCLTGVALAQPEEQTDCQIKSKFLQFTLASLRPSNAKSYLLKPTDNI
jgi:hypothetical protein